MRFTIVLMAAALFSNLSTRNPDRINTRGYMIVVPSAALEEPDDGGMGATPKVTLDGKALSTLDTIPGSSPAVQCTTDTWQSPGRWGGIVWGIHVECRRNGGGNAAQVRFSNNGDTVRTGWLAITGQSTGDVASDSYTWQNNPTVGSTVWTTAKTDMWASWRGQFPVWAAGANQPYLFDGNRVYLDCLVAVAFHGDGILPVAKNIFREPDAGVFRYGGPPAGVPPTVPRIEHWEPNNGASGTRFPRWDCAPGTVGNPNPNSVYVGQFLVLGPQRTPPVAAIERVIAGVFFDVPSIPAFYTDLVGVQRVFEGHADQGGVLAAGDRAEFHAKFTTIIRVCNGGGGTSTHYFTRIHWGPGVIQTVGALAPTPSTTATGVHIAAQALTVGEPPLQTIVDLYTATTANGRCFMARSTLEATNPGDRVRIVP